MAVVLIGPISSGSHIDLPINTERPYKLHSVTTIKSFNRAQFVTVLGHQSDIHVYSREEKHVAVLPFAYRHCFGSKNNKMFQLTSWLFRTQTEPGNSVWTFGSNYLNAAAGAALARQATSRNMNVKFN